MDCSTFNSILAGGLVALASFALAIAWDLVKYRRERAGRRQAGLAGLREEMSANRGAAGNNLTLLAVEERDIRAGKTKGLVNTLSSLETGAWAIARLDLPTALLDDHDLVRRLQIIHRNTADINSLIQSREGFRIHFMRDDNLLVDGLLKYGGILSHLLKDLQQRIDEAERELAPHLS